LNVSLSRFIVLIFKGIIACAESISAADESTVDAITRKQLRGSCLLRFLDKNIAKLSGEEEKKAKEQNLFSFVSFFVSDQQGEEDKKLFATNMKLLRTIAWVPVLQEPQSPFMPWPFTSSSVAAGSGGNGGSGSVGGGDKSLSVKTAFPVVATPLEVRPPADAWLCSGSMFLLREPCGIALQRVLGWTGTHFT